MDPAHAKDTGDNGIYRFHLIYDIFAMREVRQLSYFTTLVTNIQFSL